MFVSAEFIIDLADKNPTFDGFKKVLIENGAEFSDSFMTNLLRIIQHMKPAKNDAQKNETESTSKNPLATKFPGLAIPNEKPPVFSSDEDDSEDEKKNKRITSKDIFKDQTKLKGDEIVDQAMAELEALAPSFSGQKVESKVEDIKKIEPSVSKESKDNRARKREKSRDRSRRSRSRDKRSPNRDGRSKSRDRDRKHRSRSRNRHRSRSRDRHRSRSRNRHRSRSKDRHRRSRSRGRRSRSRTKRSHSREREDRGRYGDLGKKPRKRSPDVEISDDPEPGKVNIFFLLSLNSIIYNDKEYSLAIDFSDWLIPKKVPLNPTVRILINYF